jgi:hypothetical protein
MQVQETGFPQREQNYRSENSEFPLIGKELHTGRPHSKVSCQSDPSR